MMDVPALRFSLSNADAIEPVVMFEPLPAMVLSNEFCS
jgi:hypothetical protein